MTTPRSPPWAVLGLDPSWFPALSAAADGNDDATRSALIRRAYRRALLQHHPDKQAPGGSSGSGSGSSHSYQYTVDEIKAAYAALGGGQQSSASASLSLSLSASAAVLGGLAAGSTATGLEIVDLDELPSDEVQQQQQQQGSSAPAVQTWYRSCRCGNPRGFTFDEHDLEEELDAEAMETLAGGAADRGAPAVGELMVGCQDCSLWLCVHFAAAPDDEDDDDDEEDDEDSVEGGGDKGHA